MMPLEYFFSFVKVHGIVIYSRPHPSSIAASMDDTGTSRLVLHLPRVTVTPCGKLSRDRALNFLGWFQISLRISYSTGSVTGGIPPLHTVGRHQFVILLLLDIFIIGKYV